MNERLQESISAIRKYTDAVPSIGIVLGSGLGDFSERLESIVEIPGRSIPHYPHPTISGHAGRLIFGQIGSTETAIVQGRVHLYETGRSAELLYPIYLLQSLGAQMLILTNAAGGIRQDLSPGDLMVIRDHLNLTGRTPLKGTPLTAKGIGVYSLQLISDIHLLASRFSYSLATGVYAGVLGPSYETASEVQMIRRLGGDAVGMSTVLEATLASALGMQIAGFSCITNCATGLGSARLSHDDVTMVGARIKQRFGDIVERVVREIPKRK